MNNSYFDTARTEIMPHLPAKMARILDLGCGTGATTGAVRKARAVAWAGGVEYMPDIAARATGNFERLWVGDAAAADLEAEIAPGSLDLALCLDVLEHMVDPWTMVKRLTALLAPGGRLIVSVPNVRNYRFIIGLITRGDFRYRDFGLLDRTHLRFFVKDTAAELATCGGLTLVSAASIQTFKPHEPRGILNALTFGRLEGFLAKQWLIVAEKPPV